MRFFFVRNPSRSLVLALLIGLFPLNLPAQEVPAQGGELPLAPGAGNQAGKEDEAQESRLYFEIAFAYLLQGRDDLARRNFEKALAAGGDYSDLNRIALVRLIAREKRNPGASRLTEVQAILKEVQGQDLIGTAWMAAIEALYDYGERDAALELALEMPRRFPAAREADAAVLFSARLLFERQRRAAALDQLFYFLSRHKDSDLLDEAHFLLASIYLDPGLYYSPSRARAALAPFLNPGAGQDVFAASLWRESAIRLYSTLPP